MRPAPTIEMLSRFAFDLEVDECEVFDFSCGRFLAAGIGFEIERVASADFSMASTPPQFRGFSPLLVYNPGDAIRSSLPKESWKQCATSAYGPASKRCLSKFSADASGAVLGKIHDRDAVAVAEDKILGRSGGQE